MPLPTLFLENIILPFMPGPSKWSLSFRFTHQNPTCTSPLLYSCHMPCASHSSLFGHPTFCMDLRTNSDYFPIQHELTGFNNQGRERLLHGTSWVFKYRLFQGKSTVFGRTWDLRSFRILCSVEW
jgi:hypothetical protein